MGARKFAFGILIGAAIGGAVSLLDPNTRKDVWKMTKTASRKISETVKNPKEKYRMIRAQMEGLRDSFRELNEDLRFMTEKAAEIKELGMETIKTIEETKKVFQSENRRWSEKD